PQPTKFLALHPATRSSVIVRLRWNPQAALLHERRRFLTPGTVSPARGHEFMQRRRVNRKLTGVFEFLDISGPSNSPTRRGWPCPCPPVGQPSREGRRRQLVAHRVPSRGGLQQQLVAVDCSTEHVPMLGEGGEP